MGQLFVIRNPRGAVTDAVNECTNPNFEFGSTAPWVDLYYGPGGAGTFGLQGGIVPSPAGPNTLRKTWTTAPTGPQPGAGFQYSTAWPAGLQKSILGSFASADTTQQGILRVIFKNGSGSAVGQVDTPAQQLVTGQWIIFSNTVTAPAGATTADIQFILTAAFGAMQPNQRLLLDGVIISSTPAPLPYFDGATPAGGGYTYAWAGTPGASASYRQLPDPATDVRPTLVMGYDTTRPARNVVHQFLGGNVGAALYPASGRTGVLRLFFDDPAKAAIAERSFAGAGTWALGDDDNPAEGMTFVVTSAGVHSYQDATRRRRLLEVPYQEITA